MMKKNNLIIFAIGIFLFYSPAFSQKGIKGLVNAEKAFAAFTETHTIREGFLQYMDSAGLIFRQGVALNAIDTYQKQKPGPAILSWLPVFAVISASGDLGLTTGPYELRAKSLQDKPVARGNFSSIWQLNKKGIWKNMADLGISYNVIYPAVNKVTEIILPKQNTNTDQQFEDILFLDKKFNTAIIEKNIAILSMYLSPENWLNIEGEKPIAGTEKTSAALLAIPEAISLHSISGKISDARDFAYLYGSVVNGSKKENYLRVWIRRNKQWQVILQTIKY